ncbi:MAG: glycosyltransferase [Bacteroidetes bacterium]|nr:glycosyltransferase [Bacteroidota bacterium]MCW5895860.1 glycosyltransferase [Bacteroidota bacterium]
MNIIIVGAASPWRGGIAHHTALLFQELSKRHTVQVITFKRQYPAFLFPGKTQNEVDEMIRIPTEQRIDSVNPLTWISTGREIRKRKPDLLIFTYSLPFFGPCYGTIARVATRGTNTKVLFLCHNIVPHERRPGDVVFTKYALKAADHFIVQSDAVELDLKKFFPQAAYRKIPHPVYNIFGSPVEKEFARRKLGITDERVLLCFGYVRAYKGLLTMLEAMPMILKEMNVRLLVVGEFYDKREPYEQLMSDYELRDHVTVVSDYVANETVALYFSAADVAMLPYTSATQSGIAQIAYNFNKPVIASNVGGLGEVVRDGVTGFVVLPKDPEALAHAVLRFFKEGREKEFTANVEIEKKKYSWEAMAVAIEELVREPSASSASLR